jgi:hypothetical protein
MGREKIKVLFGSGGGGGYVSFGPKNDSCVCTGRKVAESLLLCYYCNIVSHDRAAGHGVPGHLRGLHVLQAGSLLPNQISAGSARAMNADVNLPNISFKHETETIFVSSCTICHACHCLKIS